GGGSSCRRGDLGPRARSRPFGLADEPEGEAGEEHRDREELAPREEVADDHPALVRVPAERVEEAVAERVEHQERRRDPSRGEPPPREEREQREEPEAEQALVDLRRVEL